LERYVPNAQDAHLLQYSDPQTPQGLLWFGTVPTEVASISFPSVNRPILTDGPGEITFEVDRSSGRFEGSILRSGETEAISFSGVFDRSSNSGFGYCRKGAKAGVFYFLPYRSFLIKDVGVEPERLVPRPIL
jgi:hypothetical protein